jgi:hypothetical protein
MKYLCLVYGEEQKIGEMDDRKCLACDADLRARGQCVASEALEPVATATTVRIRNGRLTVTDGPFAETKDLIAGWMVIDVDSYERAIELAGELSAAPGAGGEPIHEWLEVRPFLTAPPTVTQ